MIRIVWVGYNRPVSGRQVAGVVEGDVWTAELGRVHSLHVPKCPACLAPVAGTVAFAEECLTQLERGLRALHDVDDAPNGDPRDGW